jgi:predicted anti-sigma-YlaC factor YlaD
MNRRTPFEWLRPAMPCHVVAERLQEYLDRELDDLSARRIKRHLRACRRCGLELDVCAEIKQFLADRGESPDPAALDRLRAFGQELVEHGPPGPASA